MTKVGSPLYVIADNNAHTACLPIDRSSQGGQGISRSDGTLSLLFEIAIWCPFCGEENKVKTHPHVLKFDERGARIGDRYRLRNHIGTAEMIFSQGWFCEDCGIHYRIVEADKNVLRQDLYGLSPAIEMKVDEATGYIPPVG